MAYNANDDLSATKAKTEKDWNNLKTNAKDLKEDVKDGYSTAKNNLSDLSDKVTNISDKAGKKAKEYYNSARDNISDASDSVMSEIKGNPVRATAIALGVGFVLGLLSRSSRR